jgi:hypothetical protein
MRAAARRFNRPTRQSAAGGAPVAFRDAGRPRAPLRSATSLGRALVVPRSSVVRHLLQRGRRMNRLLAACSLAATLGAARTAHADDPVVGALEALAAPASEGGATITAAEAAHFAATVPATLSGDEAILGLVVANRLRFEVPLADDAYAAIQTALRYRVHGLATGLRQAPGFTASRPSVAAPLIARFDAAGVAQRRVDVVYTWDDWTTTRAVTLVADGDAWTGALGVAPAAGTLRYAVHVHGPDGRDFWLNHGLERGVLAGNGFLDHALPLGATLVTATAPSRPALVKLIHMFTHPDSAGGAAITSDEISLVVEQVTWSGGPGVQDDAVLVPAIAEVERLVDEGNDVEIDHAVLTGFLDRQRHRYGALPGAVLSRAADGDLRIRAGRGASVEIVYSTDGWNLPHRVRCAADRDCSLGHIPRGAVLAYAVLVIGSDGSQVWQRAARGPGASQNFFHPVP